MSGEALFYGRGSPQRSCDAFPLEKMRSMCTVMVWGGREKERQMVRNRNRNRSAKRSRKERPGGQDSEPER